MYIECYLSLMYMVWLDNSIYFFKPIEGRGGAKIRELEENTGARIKASQLLLL